MKRLVYALCIIALVVSAPVGAQEEEDIYEGDLQDEYEAYFGRDEAPRPAGPSSIEEAKKTGRGYRIGQHGKHARPKPAALGEVHVVREGDTLWEITSRYFDDPWQWPQVWSWNPEITNPHWIYPLDNIRLSQATLEMDRALKGEGGPGQAVVALGLTGQARVHRIGVGNDGGVSAVRRIPLGSVFLRDQGYLDREALLSAGQIIGGNEEHMLLSDTDQVYIRVGDNQEVKPGDELTIYRRINADERVPDAKGELVRIFGTVVVRSYDPAKKLARAEIIESLDPIERGFHVAYMERKFDIVLPKKNTSNVIAHVIASIRPREMMSYANVVFLDVGEGQGIQPGNRFFIVRREDNWQETLERSPKEMGNIVPVPSYNPEDLPKEVIAELRVIKVRKDTTIALVVRSDLDIAQGEIAEMREGF